MTILFFQYVASIIKPFLKFFQSDQPLSSFLYQDLERSKDQIKINNIESEIEKTEWHQQKSAMVRDRTKLIENEEKPTKFFFAAKKQNQKKKNVTKTKKLTQDKEIWKIAKQFYSDLYKKPQKKKNKTKKKTNQQIRTKALP